MGPADTSTPEVCATEGEADEIVGVVLNQVFEMVSKSDIGIVLRLGLGRVLFASVG